jgi:hypothetical protein
MGDFLWDSALSGDANVRRFEEYVKGLYAAGKRLCRCSKDTCGEVVPRLGDREDRALYRKSYKSRPAVSAHKRSHGNQDVYAHWLVSEILKDCVPHLRRKYGAARSSADAPVQQPMRGQASTVASALCSVDSGTPFWFAALIRAVTLICHPVH